MKDVRTSLAVGFSEASVPEAFFRLRGRNHRAIPAGREFPYEDAQFDVVMLDGQAVSRETVKEAHRVLRPEGRLVFVVPERTQKQEGLTLPDVYSIVREGFNIVEVHRPRLWFLRSRGRTLTIHAQKKNWKTLVNAYRPYV